MFCWKWGADHPPPIFSPYWLWTARGVLTRLHPQAVLVWGAKGPGRPRVQGESCVKACEGAGVGWGPTEPGTTPATEAGWPEEA